MNVTIRIDISVWKVQWQSCYEWKTKDMGSDENFCYASSIAPAKIDRILTHFPQPQQTIAAKPGQAHLVVPSPHPPRGNTEMESHPYTVLYST